MAPTDEAFRQALRDILAQTGLSMRAASLAMGRDEGYVQSLLDPARPSRARPTPDDLVRLSDVTSLHLVDLLEALWGISSQRLAAELQSSRPVATGQAIEVLPEAERRVVERIITFLEAG